MECFLRWKFKPLLKFKTYMKDDVECECRGTAIAAGASLGITCILAHQYYKNIGSLKNAFRSGTVLVTIALLVLFGISAVLLLQAGA